MHDSDAAAAAAAGAYTSLRYFSLPPSIRHLYICPSPVPTDPPNSLTAGRKGLGAASVAVPVRACVRGRDACARLCRSGCRASLPPTPAMPRLRCHASCHHVSCHHASCHVACRRGMPPCGRRRGRNVNDGTAHTARGYPCGAAARFVPPPLHPAGCAVPQDGSGTPPHVRTHLLLVPRDRLDEHTLEYRQQLRLA